MGERSTLTGVYENKVVVDDRQGACNVIDEK